MIISLGLMSIAFMYYYPIDSRREGFVATDEANPRLLWREIPVHLNNLESAIYEFVYNCLFTLRARMSAMKVDLWPVNRMQSKSVFSASAHLSSL